MTRVATQTSPPVASPSLRDLWVGLEVQVPIASGRSITYANLDNTASTPALRVVRDKVDDFLEWYSSVHRGSGYKSRVSTEAYEDARRIVGGFVGADPGLDRVIFTKHTTESVNVLAAALLLADTDIVAVSVMEHHSNMLPWRRAAQVEYIEVDPEGRLRLDSLEDILRRGAGRVRLVAVTGASNVTGYVNPIADVARLAHRYGARILVDAAQLVAHRPIDMRPHGDESHIDFLVFSGHKIYAPLGAGVLVAPRDVLDHGAPLLVGGGAVKLVTRDDVMWDEAPDREEAGSPNVVGAVALAVALRAVSDLGFPAVEAVETSLTRLALKGLAGLDRVRVLGSADPDRLGDRLGVVSFTVEGMHYSKVAAVLSHEWGIGVRDGCFCAHPYLIDLLRVDADGIAQAFRELDAGDKRGIPGATRASVAPYNTPEEVDRFLTAMRAITRDEIALTYRQDRASGSFDPTDWSPKWPAAFSLSD